MVHTRAQGPFDDPSYTYHDVGSHNDDQKEKEELNEVKEKCQILEKRVRTMEGNDICGATTMDMCLVLDLTVPAKFKTPDFKK